MRYNIENKNFQIWMQIKTQARTVPSRMYLYGEGGSERVRNFISLCDKKSSDIISVVQKSATQRCAESESFNDMKKDSQRLDQYDKSTAEKLAVISREFEAGFKFLKKYPRSVTVFGSARFKEDNPYYIHARNLTYKIAKELNYTVVTGGGPGIMEAANRGAFEAGGTSIGITISLPHEQTTNIFLTEHLPLYYFFSRKVCLSFFAEAYIFYPGGLGTLDEFFEIFTLVQTNKITEVPIILVGHDYWDGFKTIIEEKLIKEFKTIDPEDSKLFTITEDFDEIVEIIKKAPIRDGSEIENEDKNK